MWYRGALVCTCELDEASYYGLQLPWNVGGGGGGGRGGGGGGATVLIIDEILREGQCLAGRAISMPLYSKTVETGITPSVVEGLLGLLGGVSLLQTA